MTAKSTAAIHRQRRAHRRQMLRNLRSQQRTDRLNARLRRITRRFLPDWNN